MTEVFVEFAFVLAGAVFVAWLISKVIRGFLGVFR